MEDDFTYQFNTTLSPDDEIRFQQWAERTGRMADLRDYDMRGAWQSGAAQAENGHYPDTFKKPNHPTFSDDSQYHSQETPGGKWRDAGDGKWVFWASPYNVRNHGLEGIQGYFKENEPDATLILPTEALDPKGELDRLFSPAERLAKGSSLRYWNGY